MRDKYARELRTIAELRARGITSDRVRWAIRQGRWTRIIHGVVGRGPERPTLTDTGRATAYATGGVARLLTAAALLSFDGVDLAGVDVAVLRTTRSRLAGVHRVSQLPDWIVAHQVRCTRPAETLFDIARIQNDDEWEQSLEFCLRKDHVVGHELLDMADGSTDSARRIRRVTQARGGLRAPHTDSLLETLAVQLIRRSDLPSAIRQFPVRDGDGRVRYVDLCWPDLGIFLELDGQQHADQPVYDAARQNEITRLTGWRCIRLTWTQVTKLPTTTARELAETLNRTAVVR